MTTDKNGDLFYFGVCSNAPSCNTDSVACSVSSEKSTPLGYLDAQQWTEKYSDKGQGISVVYGGGEDCEGVVGKNEFTITLKCDPDMEYRITDFGSKCSESRAIIRTKYACPLYTETVEGARHVTSAIETSVSDDIGSQVPYWWIVIAGTIGGMLVVVTLVVVLVLVMRKSQDSQYNRVPVEES